MSQPPPKANDRPATWDLVIQPLAGTGNDYLMSRMRQRDKMGLAKYGVRLQSHNGRNSFEDAFEEVLDAVAYSRNALIEDDTIDGSFQLMQIHMHLMEAATVMARVIERKGIKS